MQDNYRVNLEMFEGPLDLLLYLAKRDEVDIYDIRIERITTQYLTYMDTFKMLNIDLASEFIVMAANLMYLKSRSLLPMAQQPPEEDADEADPRWELIRQLVEYKKFKDAAGFLEQSALQQERFYATSPEIPKPAEAEEEPPLDVGIFDLIRAFQGILKRFEDSDDFGEIFDERFTVTDKIEHLLETIPIGSGRPFNSLFEDATTRSEIIVTFIALLELIKLKHFEVIQEGLMGDITIHRCDGDTSEPVELDGIQD